MERAKLNVISIISLILFSFGVGLAIYGIRTPGMSNKTMSIISIGSFMAGINVFVFLVNIK